MSLARRRQVRACFARLRADFGVRASLVFTDEYGPRAAVALAFEPPRIFVSRELLRWPRSWVRFVLAHELGHVRDRTRIAADALGVLAFFVLALMGMCALLPTSGVAASVPVLLAVAMLLSRALMRSAELRADAAAARAVGSVCARRYMLWEGERDAPPSRVAKAFSTHPTLAARRVAVAKLRRASART